MSISKREKIEEFIAKNTISLDEATKDFTEEQNREVEAGIMYYDMLLSLKKSRKKLGLTQQQLADRANLPRTTITKVESGSYNPTLNTLMTIASAMNKKLKISIV